MKHLKNFDMINEAAYSAYEQVWVVMIPGDTDISHIYLDKTEAEKIKQEREESIKKNAFSRNTKVLVVSLDDAITMIKDTIKDDISFDNFNR
jgi:hypothetical protein